MARSVSLATQCGSVWLAVCGPAAGQDHVAGLADSRLRLTPRADLPAAPVTARRSRRLEHAQRVVELPDRRLDVWRPARHHGADEHQEPDRGQDDDAADAAAAAAGDNRKDHRVPPVSGVWAMCRLTGPDSLGVALLKSDLIRGKRLICTRISGSRWLGGRSALGEVGTAAA